MEKIELTSLVQQILIAEINYRCSEKGFLLHEEVWLLVFICFHLLES